MDEASSPCAQDADAPCMPFADVTLLATADGARARVHRGVLATYSGVFRGALAPDVACDGDAVLPLPGKGAHELNLLVSFLYPSSSRSEQFTKSSIAAYLALAREWDIPLMCTAAERWLVSELTHGRVVHLPPAHIPASYGYAGVEPAASAARREAQRMRRAEEAALAVRLLDAAHAAGLHGFIHAAVDHLSYAPREDVAEVRRAPGADALPSAMLHRLLLARERTQAGHGARLH